MKTFSILAATALLTVACSEQESQTTAQADETQSFFNELATSSGEAAAEANSEIVEISTQTEIATEVEPQESISEMADDAQEKIAEAAEEAHQEIDEQAQAAKDAIEAEAQANAEIESSTGVETESSSSSQE